MSLIPPLNKDEVHALIERVLEDTKVSESLGAVGQPALTDEEHDERHRLVAEGKTSLDDLPPEFRERIEECGVQYEAARFAASVMAQNPMVAMMGPEIGGKLVQGFVMGFTIAALAAQDALDGREQMSDEIDRFLADLDVTSEEDQR